MDFHYKDIVPWGRSFDEYLDMFSLSKDNLVRNILSAHLLFFYSANRDFAFHLDAVRELLRIGTEVRIFPIVDVNSNPSLFLSPVIDELEKDGVICTVEHVLYHFQKTGNQMLRLNSCELPESRI